MTPESHGFVWEFFTSAGFGGTAAVIAAIIAYRGIRRRIGFDRTENETARNATVNLAKDADARQRWWDAALWLWENNETLTPEDGARLVTTLSHLAKGEVASAFLIAVRNSGKPSTPTGNEET